MKSSSKSPKIVLTSPATELSTHHGKIFLGFGACISHPPFPLWFARCFFYPPAPQRYGEALFAPYALRKIEASLLESGFDEREIMTVHPTKLNKVVGNGTKVVGISVMDPLGLGPTSTTFSRLLGGVPITLIEFKKLMASDALRRFSPKIIVGGSGAWQLYYSGAQEKFRISTIVIGEGEDVAPWLFARAVAGEELPKVVFGEDVEVDRIPSIRRPSVDGLVEISRGCGRSCQFCAPTLRKKRDMPIDKILKEVKVNLRAGCPTVMLHAEDVLAYGAHEGFVPNRSKVMKLIHNVLVEVKEPRLGVSHITPSSIVANPKLVSEISEALEIGKTKYTQIFGYQTGIETGSVRLVKRCLAGKALPFKPESWPEVVVQAFGISKDHGWVPAATLIMGLPGELPDDVNKTIELVDRLKDCPSFIVPQFFMPVTETVLEKEERFKESKMLPEHFELLLRCIDHSVRWAEELRRRYFAPESPLLKLFSWLGYRFLYLAAWAGGRGSRSRILKVLSKMK